MSFKEYKIEYKITSKDPLEFEFHLKNVSCLKKISGSIPVTYLEAFARTGWFENSANPTRDRVYIVWLMNYEILM